MPLGWDSSYLHHHDRIAALRDYLADSVAMSKLRAAVARESMTPVHLLADQDVVELAAWGGWVSSEDLSTHVPVDIPTWPLASGGPTASSPPAPKPSPAQRSARFAQPKPKPKPKKGAEAPPTPGIDQERQAATLEAASRDGVPFCEECAKRAAERKSA